MFGEIKIQMMCLRAYKGRKLHPLSYQVDNKEIEPLALFCIATSANAAHAQGRPGVLLLNYLFKRESRRAKALKW